MGMQQKILPPGVQHADHPNLRAQMLGIGSHFQQGLSASGEQQIVEQTRVVQGEHIQLVGYGEHNMEVVRGQKFSFSCRQPALACLRLALGAISISARVIGDLLASTLRTHVYMTTQCCRAASLNSTKRFALLKIEAGSIAIQEVVALRA
jgi:hypothetical protein